MDHQFCQVAKLPQTIPKQLVNDSLPCGHLFAPSLLLNPRIPKKGAPPSESLASDDVLSRGIPLATTERNGMSPYPPIVDQCRLDSKRAPNTKCQIHKMRFHI
jgi:hypothetical protein